MTESSYFARDTAEQPAAVAATVWSTTEQRAEVAVAMSDVRRVLVVGSGDSFYLGHAAAVAMEELAGLPASAVEAYDLVSSGMAAVDEHTAVVAVSASGKAVRTLQAVDLAGRRGARTVSLTNTAGCPLEQHCQSALVTPAETSFSFPTKTTTTAIVLLAALAADLGLSSGRLDATTHGDQLAELGGVLPERLQGRLDDPSGVEESARAVAGARHTLFVGSGAARTAALIGAAKLHETARMHAGAANAEEYLHLLGFAVGGKDSVVVAPTPASWEREVQVAAYAERQGAGVVWISPWDKGDERDPASAVRVPVDGADLSPWSGAVLSSLALHQLAQRCAELRGTNPDRPENVDLDWVLNDLLYAEPLEGW